MVFSPLSCFLTIPLTGPAFKLNRRSLDDSISEEKCEQMKDSFALQFVLVIFDSYRSLAINQSQHPKADPSEPTKTAQNDSIEYLRTMNL